MITLIKRIFLFGYGLLFIEPPSERTLLFFENVSYLGLAVALSGVIGFLFKIFLVRTLGPGQYGNFSLVFSLNYFFYIPMLLGVNAAMIRYVAGTDDSRDIVATSLVSVCCLVALTVVLTMVGGGLLSRIFKVDEHILFWSLALSALISLTLIEKAVFQGLHKIKSYSYVEVVGSLLTALTWLVLYLKSGLRTYEIGIIAYMTSSAIVVIYMARLIRPHIGRFRWTQFRTIMHYAVFAILASISTFFLISIDTIMINHYFGPSILGIYSAYSTASNAVITNKILFVVLTVLFPLLSQSASKIGSLKKLDRFYLAFLAGLWVIGLALTAIVIKFFGGQYPLQFGLLALFAASTALNFIAQVYIAFILAEGIRGVRANVFGLLFVASVNLVLNLVLIPHYGIYGAVSAACGANLLLLIYAKYQSHKIYAHVPVQT